MKHLLTLKINVVVMATYVVMLMIPELLVLEDLHTVVNSNFYLVDDKTREQPTSKPGCAASLM